MPYMTLSNLLFYVMSPLLFAGTAIILWLRGWLRLYPAFFTLLWLKVVTAAVFVPLAYIYTQSHNKTLYRYYFYSFWGVGFAEVLLVLLILYRLFAAAFAGYSLLSRWTFVLYMIALVVCLLLAIYVMPSRIQARGVVSIAVPIWQSSLIFSAGMLAFLFLVVFGIGISLRDYLFGIAMGLGLNAVINLLTAVLSVQRVWLVTYGSLLADFVAAGVWFAYLFVSHRSPPPDSAIRGGDEIPSWKDALTEFLQK